LIVLRLAVLKLSYGQTDKQTNTPTNKQTPLKTSTSLRYATPVGNNIVTTSWAVVERSHDAADRRRHFAGAAAAGDGLSARRRRDSVKPAQTTNLARIRLQHGAARRYRAL